MGRPQCDTLLVLFYYYFMDNKKLEVVVPIKLKIGCIGSQTPYHNGVGQNSKAWHQHERGGIPIDTKYHDSRW